MPGLIVFRRRWAVGSDDLVIPAVFLILFHFIWLIIILTTLIQVRYFDGLNQTQHSKPTEENPGLKIEGILSGLFLDWSLAFFVEILISVVSMKGSVLKDGPRHSIEIFMYIKLALWIVEIALTVLCGKWLYANVKALNYQMKGMMFNLQKVIYGLVICNSVMFLIALTTMWCTWDQAGRSWVKLKKYQQSLKSQNDANKNPKLQYRRSGGGKSKRNWRQRKSCILNELKETRLKEKEAIFSRKVRRAYENSWDHRCHLLFCCISSSSNKSNSSSFTDIAKLLSEFFRDLDVVPSDIVVGLVLLRKHQQLLRIRAIREVDNPVYLFLSGVKVTPATKFLSKKKLSDLNLLNDIVHYMHFAVGVYGWPMYVRKKTTLAVCRLCSQMTRDGDLSLRTDSVVLGDNCCGCNLAAYAQMCENRLPELSQIVYMTYHVDVGETPFLIAVDFEREVIVISIRGTLSLKDILTDLNAEGEPLPNEPDNEDWIGHKGMVFSATYIYNKLKNDSLLKKAFNWTSETQQYQLVCVGHSLGAGTATILAIMLQYEFPGTKCFAYSPPGGLLSETAVNYSREFITSVVIGKDVVPRVGLRQLEILRHDLMHAIYQTDEPKYKTLASTLSCCGGGNQDWSQVDIKSGLSTSESQATRKNAIANHPLDSSIQLTVHQPLYPPGKIVHLVRYHPRKLRANSTISELDGPALATPFIYKAIWADNQDFNEVLISKRMVEDHMPDNVLDALKKFMNQTEEEEEKACLFKNSEEPLLETIETEDSIEMKKADDCESRNNYDSNTSFYIEIDDEDGGKKEDSDENAKSTTFSNKQSVPTLSLSLDLNNSESV